MRGNIKLPSGETVSIPHNPYNLYKKRGLPKPKIKKAGRGKVKVMSPVDVYENYVEWKEEEVERTLWKCVECGRVWGSRWQAILCSLNGHRDFYEALYSYRNGKYLNKFYCVRREEK